MPTPTTSDLPTPKSWDEFEDIVWKIYRREWQDSHAQRYGRSGQCQNGVDIYGQQNGSGRYIAVQCKRYKDGKLNCKKIEEEISKAESFSSVISEYVIATTESRDTKIQDCIRRLNTRREPEGKFKVYVVFWEDLCDKLTTLSNQDLFKDCYPEWGRIFKAPDLNIDWYQISQFRSGEQQRLTTNFLTRNEEITYHFEQVYVPLGLEERKKIPRRRDDIAPEEGSKLYRETEITQTFEHEQFLDQVFRQKQSPKSQGRRIAIIGKPGAGKTTRLQQIAQWVTKKLKQTVIWVSLSALEGQTLEEYLLKTWLKNRLQVANVSPEQENAFVEWFRFKDSQIWLLLDGADEMSSGTHASSLQAIAYQITGWVGQARIVLTCRQNLWDSYAHDVETFDSYRTLEFSYPTQVEQFIENWFAPSSAEEATRGQRLCVALHERGRERIQDLVRNPLLLTLLCLDWHVREGKLPKTRAALYEQFTEDFYEWKKKEIPTTYQQREQLNAKLSELALEAIETETNRFCLRQEFVCKFMGEPEDKGSLFYLALELGWLNKVGVDANNRRKPVYAFLHPTFEEYFAALQIERSLTFEQLLDELVVKRYHNKAWHEILQMVCGIMIDVKRAVELIELLRSAPCICNFLVADCVLEIKQSPGASSLRKSVLKELKNAVHKSLEYKNAVESLKRVIRLDFSLKSSLEWLKSIENFVEPHVLFQVDEDEYEREDNPILVAAVDVVAQHYSEDPGTLPWLKKCVQSESWEVAIHAFDYIASIYRDNPSAFLWLKENAGYEPLMQNSYRLIAEHYRDDPTTLPWLKSQLLPGVFEDIRAYALEAIAEAYSNNFDMFQLISSQYYQEIRDSDDPFVTDPGWFIRKTAVKMIAEHFFNHAETWCFMREVIVREDIMRGPLTVLPEDKVSIEIRVGLMLIWCDWGWMIHQLVLETLLKEFPDHPNTLPLLHHHVINSENEQMRQWATGQLRCLEQSNPGRF